MTKTIYLSGAISGGRGDIDLYRRIADALEGAGHRLVSRHVADPSVGPAGDRLGAQEIFERDWNWIEEAANERGVLVAEVSVPSIGVGYEVAVARYKFALPVICLYRSGPTQRCSAMVAGDWGIRLIEYEESGVAEMLSRLLAQIEQL